MLNVVEYQLLIFVYYMILMLYLLILYNSHTLPFLVHSRVHITKQTLEFLQDKFEVEEGNGGSRDTYLADHKIESYLIVPPKVKYDI